MEVEIYIGFGYNGGSWGTDYVTVPDDLQVDTEPFNDFIDNWIKEEDKKGKMKEVVAFWGIYNIPSQECE